MPNNLSLSQLPQLLCCIIIRKREEIRGHFEKKPQAWQKLLKFLKKNNTSHTYTFLVVLSVVHKQSNEILLIG